MNELLEKASSFAHEVLRTKFPASLAFHNATHIEQVAAHAAELARAAELNEKDTLALCLAAWGHDLGYADGVQGHEERGAALFGAFLREQSAPEGLVAKVEALIRATRPDAMPANELERLMKDADMGHIGSADYPRMLAHLHKEREARSGKAIDKKEWTAENVSFLERFSFSSAVAHRLWDAQRAENLNALKAMQEENDEGQELPAKVKDPAKQAAKAEKKAKKKEREKIKETERGVDTMFRVTLANHMRLSQVADRKAGTLLSVNALIISLSMSRLTPKVSQHPELYVPLFMLMAVCVLTIIFATLATRPKITHGTTTKEAIARREANLLFFGNFHSMDYPDFDAGMRGMMEDRDYLYGSLTRDLYGLGKVLDRKYRLLRLTYNIFMFGIVGVVALMVYVTVMFGSAF